MNRRRFLANAGVAAVATGFGLATYSIYHCRAGYDAYTAALHRSLDLDGGVRELVRMASLAPNGHNTQPWRFRASARTLAILPDFARRTPVVDPDDHHLFVSLGAAAENLAVAGPAMGMPGQVAVHPDGSVAYEWSAAKRVSEPLTEAIVRRQSTRSVFDGRAIAAADLNALEMAAHQNGVRLVLLTEPAKIAALRDLVIAGNDRQMSDPAFVAELKTWIRFSAATAMDKGDGLYGAASGNPTLPDFAGRAAFDAVFKKKSEADKYATQMDSSSGIAVFFAEKADPQHWVTVGCSLQRFLLEATAREIACAFVNQPVEVAGLRTALASLCGEKGLRPDLVVRFGRAPRLPYSPRRPVNEILA